MRATVMEPGEGETLALGLSRLVYKATGGDVEERLAMAEVRLAPGDPGEPLHRHAETHEIAYVLEGVVRFRLGAQVRDLGPGAVVLVPPGVAHAYLNPHDQPARLLSVVTPAGHEGYLREVAARGVVDPDELARIGRFYDVEPAE